MTNQELLLAISGVLQDQLTPVKTDIRELKEGMSELLRRMDDLDERMDGLECRMNGLEQRVTGLEQDMAEVKQKVDSMEQHTRNLELTLENGVMPRLRTIEACYTSTYSRYADGVWQFDAMESDISLMKKVIMEHSEKLGTLS